MIDDPRLLAALRLLLHDLEDERDAERADSDYEAGIRYGLSIATDALHDFLTQEPWNPYGDTNLPLHSTREEFASDMQEYLGGTFGYWAAASTPWDVSDLLDDLEEAQRNLEEALDNPRDQYHTMDELYWYRMLYNALAANAMPQVAVKSWRHSGGELCFGGGWFVVYLLLPTGQVSNHYKAEYWDLFQIPQIEKAPEYDGHTPQIAAERLLAFVSSEPVHNSVQDLTERCVRLRSAVGVASLRLAEESARVGELTAERDTAREHFALALSMLPGPIANLLRAELGLNGEGKS